MNDWRELLCTSHDPCEFGWIRGPRQEDDYEPVGSEDPIAPEKLQNLISCSCKQDCSNNSCSCKKNNVKCMSFCTNCRGCDCKNASINIINEQSCEISDDSEDSSNENAD